MMEKELIAVYQRIRREEQEAFHARVRDAYARQPQLEALDQKRRDIIKSVGEGKRSAEEAAQALDAVTAEERAMLAALSLPADTLRLHYRCPVCRDTGYTDALRQTPCACSARLSVPVDPLLNLNPTETFASFRSDIFPDETQKKRTLNAKKLCEAYADALPLPEYPNLLILGMPGLGKSFLANAIASRAVERGVRAVRVTAYRFTSDILTDIREKTKNAERYQNAPLLVLDDLGTEPMIPNVSIEWLFAIINERLSCRRASVIVTNLSLPELQDRYGERLMSRLSDRNSTKILQLSGSNLRW